MRKRLPRLFLVVGSLLPATFLLARGELRAHPPGGHQHRWRSVQPPDGLVRLVDEHGRALKWLYPAQVARVEVIGLPNTDQCVLPDCPFGVTGCVVEPLGPRAVSFSDGSAGGRFGFRGPLGQFAPLLHNDVARITHYRAPSHTTTLRLSARFDDTGRATDDRGRWVPTYDDPATDGRPWYYVVTRTPSDGKTTKARGRRAKAEGRRTPSGQKARAEAR